MEPFVVDIGRIPSLSLDLEPTMRAEVNTDSPSAHNFLHHLANVFRKPKQFRQDAQVDIVIKSNMCRAPHPFQVGDSVFIDTSKLLIGYANLQHYQDDD
jgi:hypothetical protein